MRDLDNGAYVPATSTFYAMLVDATYVPDRAAHAKRSDVTGEVVGSGGYTAKGQPVALTLSSNPANHKRSWSFSSPSWSSASITARAVIIYNFRGGVASSDELVAYVDFGMDVISVNGSFPVIFSSALTFEMVDA
jgi:hypothetical protein